MSMQDGFKAWLKLLVNWLHTGNKSKDAIAQEAGARRGWLQINDIWTVLIYISTNSFHFQKYLKEKTTLFYLLDIKENPLPFPYKIILQKMWGRDTSFLEYFASSQSLFSSNSVPRVGDASHGSSTAAIYLGHIPTERATKHKTQVQSHFWFWSYKDSWKQCNLKPLAANKTLQCVYKRTVGKKESVFVLEVVISPSGSMALGAVRATVAWYI